MKVLDRPQVVKGVVVVLSEGAKGLELTGLKEATGKKLWAVPVHPGWVPSGVNMGVNLSKTAKGKNVALFLQKSKPRDGWTGDVWTMPVAVNITSGKVVYKGPAQVITSRPQTCPDGKDMCYLSINPYIDDKQRMRVDLDRGTQRTLTPRHKLGDSIFPISGGELYGHYSGNKSNLLRLKGNDKLWGLSLAKAMGSTYTPGEGWNIDYSEKLGIYSGWIGHESKETKGSKGKVIARDSDFSQEMMIGLDAKTGKTLWKAKGASTFCLPPMGRRNTVLEDGKSYPVRCVFDSGTLEEAEGTKSKIKNGKLHLEGFDPKTGKVIWKTKNYTVATDIDVAHVPDDGGASLFLAKEKKPTVLDTRTGETRNITAEERFLCTKGVQYAKPQEGTGGTILFPCTADGKEAKGVSAGALQAQDGEGSRVVLGFAGSVVAFPSEP
ncbi:PQQ-binding-like beta-propeller repeat protein [Paeniglutamicibacter sp. MACA_103]|uniref:outer membrane protein assembly factor BamB family protein n=1 Tax=Paeniglutamicibacter sp. MACA_103 TaxID=3377337 RepID=UPI0038940AA3